MDGVIVNLMKGADAVVGGSFVTFDKEKRWNMINQTKGFWENLEWMPSSKRLYKFIMRYDTFILSAYSGRDPSSKNGKMKWLNKNTNFKKSRIKLVKRAQKQAYATTNGEPNILIDDYIKNINEWEAKGGIGIRHTDVGKTINRLKQLGFK
jgi:5'(3')-deoxyribonucleotidase